MRIILIRHGETLENAKRVIMGHHHGTLSEMGLEQAQKVAERLKDEIIHAIYSSDLQRTANTARAIAKHHPEIPFNLTELLRERNWGDFQGKQKDEINWPEKYKQYLVPEAKPLNGETLLDMYSRSKDLLLQLLEKHKGQTIVLVGHNQINKAFSSNLLNQTPEDFKDLNEFKNTSVSIFDLSNPQEPKTILLDCIKHLE